MSALLLRNARAFDDGRPLDVEVVEDRIARVAEPGTLPPAEREVDLSGRVLLPALVNAHDHLDFSSFPALGRPPYRSLYEWADEVRAGEDDPAVRAALSVELSDRLFLGGLRNLLAGASAVAHHGAPHRSLGREDFPVRVLLRYQFAHSPGLTTSLRKTYRSSDRRIPWMIHAAEGTDERCRAEIASLVEQRLLRHNTVVVHALGAGEQDAAALAAASACVVWCPESNRRLYGAAAPIELLRRAGVRIGLGSDSPVSGVRDALSNLAAARAEGFFSDQELLELATAKSAEVARLPAGALAEGAPADLLAVSSLDELLQGRREAVALVMVAGRALLGAPELGKALPARASRIAVDGAPRLLERTLARRAASLLQRHRALREGVGWCRGLQLDMG
jgi:cytosine/adenosine deaminase-related metal-dependent hydrolase